MVIFRLFLHSHAPDADDAVGAGGGAAVAAADAAAVAAVVAAAAALASFAASSSNPSRTPTAARHHARMNRGKIKAHETQDTICLVTKTVHVGQRPPVFGINNSKKRKKEKRHPPWQESC